MDNMENINAKEILEIALQNEKNGVEFYQKLSRQVVSEKARETLLGLSRQESEHVATIKDLLNRLVEERKELDYYDDPEELLYLKAIADSSLFEDNQMIEMAKERFPNVVSALHFAVGVEIKSIEFYKGLFELMRPDANQDVVQILIDQEKEHVRTLHFLIKEHEG